MEEPIPRYGNRKNIPLCKSLFSMFSHLQQRIYHLVESVLAAHALRKLRLKHRTAYPKQVIKDAFSEKTAKE